MNIKNKIEQIALLSKTGQFPEMETVCLQVLKQKPGDFNALQFLGLALSKQGRQEEAIIYFLKALKINSSFAAVHNNLGYAYLEAGKYKNALACFKEAIDLDPGQAEIFNNLGIVYFKTKKYKDSLAAYDQAINLSPKYSQAFDNRGVCLRETGLLHDAIDQHLIANDLDPSSLRIYVHLFQTLLLSHITDDALHVANAGLEISDTTSHEHFELLIGKAIISWLTGQYETAHTAIENCSVLFPQVNSDSKTFQNDLAYHRLIQKLLYIRSDSPYLYQGDRLLPLFFIGDSHCLPPSETVVTYKGKSHRILASLIKGCKAWHLGNDTQNGYKTSLDIIFKALPKGSKIIVGMGEIDCRFNEGILPAHQASGIDIHSSIENLVSQYVKYVSNTAEQYDHSLIFYGVPAPSHAITALLETKQEALFKEVIQLFNMSLAQACASWNWEVLDVYGLTSNIDKVSNNQFHIDTYHLHPETIKILFQSYLLTP